MKEAMRRSIAFAVASQVLGQAPSAIYCHEDARYHNFSGTPQEFYDSELGCHITFQPENNFYHHGLKNHFSVDVNDDQSFAGYDHGEGHYFRGTVAGKAITLYDHGEERWFNYGY